MPRPRTGQLVLRSGIWHARVRVTRDGKTTRDWYTLDTADFAKAERLKDKLVEDLAAGRSEVEACARANAPDTLAAYAEAIGDRLSEGDRANLRLHALPGLGTLALADVRPAHVKAVRDKVIATAAKRGTVGKVLGAFRRLLAAAVEDELLEVNPAAEVKLPKQRGEAREIVKPRAILTDAELVRFLVCESIDLELRTLAAVARCEGGMRTSDLHAWCWQMLDLDAFTFCTIPRSKTAAPEVLDVPEMLRPVLRGWWERHGSPVTGPVFPVRKGDRAGERKATGSSYAERLRRELFRAGVVRLPPVEVPLRRPGQRTDLGKVTKGTMPAPNPRDPLYFETPVSLPVDFHSFRRAFGTALAAAGVNVQRAMKLAGHSDGKTHARYIMDSPEMRAIPDAALPRLLAVPIRAQSPRAPANHRGSEGDEDGGDDDANSLKTSVSRVRRSPPKPKATGSNPVWRAESFRGLTRAGGSTRGQVLDRLVVPPSPVPSPVARAAAASTPGARCAYRIVVLMSRWPSWTMTSCTVHTRPHIPETSAEAQV